MAKKYFGGNFNGTEVRIDNSEFTECVFVNCRIIYNGSGNVVLNKCEFNNCHWYFEGEAGNTIRFLSSIYHNLGDDGSKLVESIFNSIRNHH